MYGRLIGAEESITCDKKGNWRTTSGIRLGTVTAAECTSQLIILYEIGGVSLLCGDLLVRSIKNCIYSVCDMAVLKMVECTDCVVSHWRDQLSQTGV